MRLGVNDYLFQLTTRPKYCYIVFFEFRVFLPDMTSDTMLAACFDIPLFDFCAVATKLGNTPFGEFCIAVILLGVNFKLFITHHLLS